MTTNRCFRLRVRRLLMQTSIGLAASLLQIHAAWAAPDSTQTRDARESGKELILKRDAVCIAALMKQADDSFEAIQTKEEASRWINRLQAAIGLMARAHFSFGVSEKRARQEEPLAREHVSQWSRERIEQELDLCLQAGQQIVAQAPGWQQSLARQGAQRKYASLMRRALEQQTQAQAHAQSPRN